MSYTNRVIGSREVIQEDRIIVVAEGADAPTPASGFGVILIGSHDGVNIYLEYRVYEGSIVP